MRDLFSSHTQSDGIPDKTHRIAVLRRLRADTERRLQEATERAVAERQRAEAVVLRAEGLEHAVQSERKGRFMDKLRAIGASASEASLSSHAHGKDARRGTCTGGAELSDRGRAGSGIPSRENCCCSGRLGGILGSRGHHY